MSAQLDRLKDLLNEKGVLRSRELDEYDLPRTLLKRAVDLGEAVRVTEGVYVPSNHEYTEHHELAVVSKLVPESVVCLISALSIHGLTTEIPHRIWLMIESNAWGPKVDDFEIEIVRASGDAFQKGRETRTIEGVKVPVTIPAKTVADCFRYRSRIGLDVAIESMREGFEAGLFTMDELWECAEADRVTSVIRPYAEAM